MYQVLITLIALTSIAISGWAIPKLQQAENKISSLETQTFGAQNAVGGGVYYLSGAGTSASASSLGLTKFGYTQPNGVYAKFTMTNFGDLGCVTIQPGNASGKQEFASFTGITQSADGTATLSGVTRGLERYEPFSASTTLQTAHAGGSEVVVSNSPPCFYQNYAATTQNESVTGLWNFTQAPIDNGASTSTLQFATRGYANSLAIQGAATSTYTASGIGLLATGAQAALGTYKLTQPYFLSSAISTSTYFGNGSNKVIITGSDNLIDKNFLPTTTTGIITWAASTTQNGLQLFNAFSIFNGGASIASSTQASSTITKLLATNATTTSFAVLGTSTTTNQNISGQCNGCINSGGQGYQIVTAAGVFDGETPSLYSVSMTCPENKMVVSGGWNQVAGIGAQAYISYPSATTTWQFNLWAGGNGISSAVSTYIVCLRP